MKDRVVQAAAKLALEPIFEADFEECSHGFRPRRGATGALETIRVVGGRELTDRRRRAGMKDLREVIGDLNPVLVGWGNYFRTGNASLRFQRVDSYV